MVERLLGGRRGGDLVAEAFPQPRQPPANRLLVIDN
jgi:hypothetical protein